MVIGRRFVRRTELHYNPQDGRSGENVFRPKFPNTSNWNEKYQPCWRLWEELLRMCFFNREMGRGHLAMMLIIISI